MKSIFDYFSNDFLDSSLDYHIPLRFTGIVNLNGIDVESFEFQLRVHYNLGSNVKLLCFYLKSHSYVGNLISNIIDNLAYYKARANEVKVTEPSNSEIAIGEVGVMFSDVIYFYTEERLSENLLQELMNTSKFKI